MLITEYSHIIIISCKNTTNILHASNCNFLSFQFVWMDRRSGEETEVFSSDLHRLRLVLHPGDTHRWACVSHQGRYEVLTIRICLNELKMIWTHRSDCVCVCLGSAFPSGFMFLIQKIFVMLFRTLAHLFSVHYQEAIAVNIHPHLNTLFTHFITFSHMFRLLEPSETAPIDELIAVLTHWFTNTRNIHVSSSQKGTALLITKKKGTAWACES